MSKHKHITTNKDGKSVTVTLGYDRPLGDDEADTDLRTSTTLDVPARSGYRRPDSMFTE